MENLVVDLYHKDIIQFGNFTLKSGCESSVYVDLRKLISHPKSMILVADLIHQHIEKEFDVICGVAWGAIPLATTVSIRHDIPMIIKRKHVKEHGTKRLIEGEYQRGDKCVLIDDVVTSGTSILETLDDLERNGIEVVQIIVVVDRGVDMTLFPNHILTSCINLEEIVDIMENKLFPTLPIKDKLGHIMRKKQTNLTLSVDVTTSNELLELADKIGPHICILKTHMEIVEDFNEEVVRELMILAKKHQFLIMEDRKFADIGSIVQKQLKSGTFKISTWADLITVYGMPGPSILESIQDICTHDRLGVVLIAQLSSEGNFLDESYKNAMVELAKGYKDIVVGFISQEKISDGFYHLTPGINISTVADDKGQLYNTPEMAMEKGTDIIIVGRGIYQATNPVDMAIMYKDCAHMSS